MFEAFLAQHDRAAWARTRESLAASMHEVDRDATRIWFHFFPLKLAQAFAQTDSADRLVRKLELEGAYRLDEQRDTSHWFLYGHRFWPAVRAAIIKRAESQAASSLDLASIIREIAEDAATRRKVPDESLVVGIAAVGLMTLQQMGLARFSAGPEASDAAAVSTRSPAQIVAARKKNDSQGLFGVFRGIRSEYSVRFDERRETARFTLINGQHLTTAAANDTRDYSGGPRRYQEGPIPIRCRSAACGSCWVGVLGGAEKLTPVEPLERERMREFGYVTSDEPQPLIRLACMARGSGNVTIVIPPWQGSVGKAGLGGV